MTAADLVFFFDITGSIAFAFSGAVVAVRRRLDLFGVIILAIITASGGGILRDLICGINPPRIFTDLVLLSLASGVALITFVFFRYITSLQKIINVFDAIGLGIFTMAGVQTALQKDLNILSCILVGAITASGGGILRDVLVNRIPYIMRREMYASIALAGGGCYFTLVNFISASWASYGSILLVIFIRLMAMHFDWHLSAARPRD